MHLTCGASAAKTALHYKTWRAAWTGCRGSPAECSCTRSSEHDVALELYHSARAATVAGQPLVHAAAAPHACACRCVPRGDRRARGCRACPDCLGRAGAAARGAGLVAGGCDRLLAPLCRGGHGDPWRRLGPVGGESSEGSGVRAAAEVARPKRSHKPTLGLARCIQPERVSLSPGKEAVCRGGR